MPAIDPDVSVIAALMDRRLADRDLIRRLQQVVRYQSDLIAVLLDADQGGCDG